MSSQSRCDRLNAEAANLVKVMSAEQNQEIILRVHYVSGSDVMRRLWRPDAPKGTWYGHLFPPRDLGLHTYAVPILPERVTVMDWSLDGPVVFGDHRWILYGPMVSEEAAKEAAGKMDLSIVEGWYVERVWQHAHKYHLSRTVYTDG